MVNESYRPDHESDEAVPNKADAHKKRLEGEALWVDMPSEEAIKERDETIELLEKYDKEAGTDTSKFRDHLRKVGNKPSELKKLLKKLDKVADKEWLRRAENHEAFNVTGKLGNLLHREMRDLQKSFRTLDLKDGAYNKFRVLSEMGDMLDSKAKFVKRYKKQSPLVRRLYEQSMGSLDFMGSKEELLDEVLELVGDLEDSPEAIQSEFMKRSPKIKNADKMKVMQAKLILEYEEMSSRYSELITKNEIYFGGDTANEFKEWFRDQKSFAKMKHALILLPKYIKERKEEHGKIEGLLQGVDEKQGKRFRQIIGKMGLSERKSYRKSVLEPAVRTGGLLAAEYEGEMLAAHEERMPLYTAIERSRLAARFKTLNQKQQKQVMAAERLNIARRKQVIKDYTALPLKVREDDQFFKANAITREEILWKAQQKQAELEAQSAFAELDEGEHLTDEQISDITSSIGTKEGENILDEAMNSQVQEQERRNISNVISLAKWKMDHALEANQKGETQQETFIRDYEHWKVGLSEGDHHKDHRTQDEWIKGSKIKEAQMAKNLYEKGFTTHSNSSLHERQDLTRDDLVNLRGGKISEAMSTATYDTDIHLAESDEREPMDVAAMLGEVVEELAEKMAREMAAGIAEKIKAHGSNKNALVNSLTTAKNIETLKSRFWDKEMGERGKVLRDKRIKKAA